MRVVAASVGALMLGALASSASAASIFIPNHSFESPTVANSSPFATPNIDNWLKAPPPQYWIDAELSTADWYNSGGIFLDVPFAPVSNVDGQQLGFMFSSRGFELYQDLTDTFKVGHTYDLSVLIEGGGFGMAIGVPIEMRLYYRDSTITAGDDRVTIGTKRILNDHPLPANSGDPLIPISLLDEHHLTLPEVTASDPWADKTIGIQFITSMTDPDVGTGGGYWDLDKVQLIETPVPEPASAMTCLVLAGGLLMRKRRIA